MIIQEIRPADRELNFLLLMILSYAFLFQVELLSAKKVKNFYGNLYLQSQKNLGVITVSSGNFAVALAYQGNSLGIPVTVLLPESTSPVNIRMCERFDADTRISSMDEGKVINVSSFMLSLLVVFNSH